MLKIEEQRDGSVVVLSLDGRLEGLTAPDLEKAISTLVEGGDVHVLLECSAMVYVSSAGIRSFILGARACQQNDGKLAICALQPSCRSVMEISGCIDIIDCAETREAAMSKLAASS